MPTQPPAPPAPSPAPPTVTFFASAAELGAAVRAARKSMGLTLVQAARRCRVGPRFLLELERGKPSVHLGKVLAVTYGLGLAAMLVPLAMVQAALGQK
jgi:hypothetical protein